MSATLRCSSGQYPGSPPGPKMTVGTFAPKLAVSPSQPATWSTGSAARRDGPAEVGAEAAGPAAAVAVEAVAGEAVAGEAVAGEGSGGWARTARTASRM